jgi:hypothetical protein
MIYPYCFGGIVVARAIDMILHPPFMYNPLNKNEETNLIDYSEAVEVYTGF